MNFKRLLTLLTPPRTLLLCAVCLLLIGSAMNLAKPWLAGQFTALLLSGGGWFDTFFGVFCTWMAIVIGGSLAAFASSYLMGSTGEAMLSKLRAQVFAHGQRLPLAYYDNRRPGDTLSLLSKDAEIIGSFVSQTLVQLLPLMLSFFGALVLMAALSPPVAVLTMLLTPLYFLLMKTAGRELRPLSRRWIEAWSSTMAFAEENFRRLATVKAFTHEAHEIRQFGQENEALVARTRSHLFYEALLPAVAAVLAGLGLALMLWVGQWQLEQGALSAPDLVTLVLYATMLTAPLGSLANLYGQLMNTRGASERLIAFLDEPLEESPERPGDSRATLPMGGGEIDFKGVTFGYLLGQTVLKDFSLNVPAGQVLALTGSNGAGKSSLIHLLLRFYDPLQGTICIDGTDIGQVSLRSLRENIGLVAQHTVLLNASVEDNIRYGDASADQAALTRAAQLACAEDFIQALPLGYRTVIGEQGLKLSGGQRQRIALARALLKNPSILLLDEATSMLDPEGEQQFVKHCEAALAGRTVILVTHRPAMLALADHVVCLPSSTHRYKVEAG